MTDTLRFGWSGLPRGDFGQGPGGDTGAPRWLCTQIVPTPGTISGIIDDARSAGMRLICNFAGNRNNWTNPGTGANNGQILFDWNKYETQVRLYQGDSKVQGAIDDNTLLPFTCDEPHLKVFDDLSTPGSRIRTIPTSIQNDMGLLLKSVFNNCLTCQRSSADTLNDAGNGLPVPNYTSSFTGTLQVGWTGLDYGMAQWNRSASLSGLSPRAWWNNERARLLAINCGMIPMENWINGGDGRNWDYLNSGTSVGRIQGDSGAPYWLMSPAEIDEHTDGIWDDAKAPCMHGYNYATTSNQISNYLVYMVRPDFVAAFDRRLNKFATRPTFDGFRTPKSGGGGGGGGSSFRQGKGRSRLGTKTGTRKAW